MTGNIYSTEPLTVERQVEVLDLQTTCPVCKSPVTEAIEKRGANGIALLWINRYSCGAEIDLLAGCKYIASKPCLQALKSAMRSLEEQVGAE